MSTTYINRLHIKDIYDIFSNNRKNKLSYFGIKPKNGNYYLDSFINNNYAYVYAKKSSPYPLNENGANTAYFKVNNTTYNFYTENSYTYTEGVSVTNDNVRLFLLAYDYVSNSNNFETLNNHAIKMENVPVNHTAGQDEYVNVYSDITYCIESSETNAKIDVVNELQLTYNDFKLLMGNKNYVDCTSYIKYSYIQHNTPHNGIVNDDGTQKLSNGLQHATHGIRDFRVWSFKNGYDKTPYTYVNDSDSTSINAYAYINLGLDSRQYFCEYPSVAQKIINADYLQKTSTTFTQAWSIGHDSNNNVYIKETGQQYRNFYKNSKPYNLSGHENESFTNLCSHPSYRNNERNCDFYVDIKANSNRSSDDLQYQKWVNDNNYNTCKYIKTISLPIHIVNNSFILRFNLTGDYSDVNAWVDQYYQQHADIQNLHAVDTGVLRIDFSNQIWCEYQFTVHYIHRFNENGFGIQILSFEITSKNESDYLKLTNDSITVDYGEHSYAVDGQNNINIISFNFDFYSLNFENIKKDILNNCQITLTFNDLGGHGIKLLGPVTQDEMYILINNESHKWEVSHGGGQQTSNYEKISLADLDSLHYNAISLINYFDKFSGSISNDNANVEIIEPDVPTPQPNILSISEGMFDFSASFMGSGMQSGTYIHIDNITQFVMFEYDSDMWIKIKPIMIGPSGHQTTLNFKIYNNLAEAQADAGELEYDMTNGLHCNANTKYYLRIEYSDWIYWSALEPADLSDAFDQMQIDIQYQIRYATYNFTDASNNLIYRGNYQQN